tara:strand:+ start:108 stop:713 length:606 start_codon:yes stop_codon:yes gene_type:complete
MALVVPTQEHPIPYDLTDETPTTLLDELAVAGNTAELQVAMGAPLEVTAKDEAKEKALLDAVANKRKVSNLKSPTTAYAAASFLRTYGQQLALDAAQARGAITNKLMEIANCGDTRYELKALELLGKHSDIGIFTQRSELTIKYQNPADLEDAIKERVKRLLNASLVDVAPLNADLDEELGVFTEPELPDLAKELEVTDGD